MTELLGVLLGSLLTYYFAIHQSRRERGQRVAALATGLLSELIIVDANLRMLYADADPDTSYGEIPVPLIERLDVDTLQLKPEAVHALLRIRGTVLEIHTLRKLCNTEQNSDKRRQLVIRMRQKAGLVLQRIPALKHSLEASGGQIFDGAPVLGARPNQLPRIPDSPFKRVQMADGEVVARS